MVANDVVRHIAESCPSTFDLDVNGQTHRYGCGETPKNHLGRHRFMIEWDNNQSSNEFQHLPNCNPAEGCTCPEPTQS